MGTVFLLFICEALTRTAATVVLATMALTGQDLAPHKMLATLPIACVPIATMLTTVPAAQMMRRWGRKPGFALGTVLGVVGGLVCAGAIYVGQFALLCAGALAIGAVNGFATYYRFAAAEVVEEAQRSRAISLVMAGGVVAAVAGAQLAAWSRDWLAPHIFAGSFVCIAAVQGAILVVLVFARLPKPQTEELQDQGRPLREIALRPDFALALLGALTGYGVMSLLMHATPLSMDRHHHTFVDMTRVIQWHVLGMYVPAFFTGHLIRWQGEIKVMLAGVAVLVASVLVNTAGAAVPYYLVGLLLLGAGWNFLFVGGTSLLTTTYEPSEKAKVQSANDFMVFGVMAVSTFSAGTLEELVGWKALNWGVIPLLVLVALAIILLRQRAGVGQNRV